ncbi:hypothetical protein QCE63_13010 [Caballeronia sp. LZ065]|uniref:hypothetical protein n=1 Tax=Caballeronia sp. LZ065 TaxID=3038571 RepID=UPI00285C7524|nr:hypothetical protein [Caballeronia sp. LZ065]MDR5780339.1 hypothetical protein [Caballeronia sp. LZ065]
MRRFFVERSLNARYLPMPSPLLSGMASSAQTRSRTRLQPSFARAARAADWIPEGRSCVPVDEPTHHV